MSLDEAVRRAAPITDDELDALTLDAFEAELREAIVARPVRRRPPRRRRRLVPAAGALVAAALAATIVLLSGSGGGTDRAWAAEAVRVAEAVPRLLIDGWTVTRADQFDAGVGEMTFTDGTATVDLSWERGGAPVSKDGIVGWRQDGYALALRGERAAEARGQLRAVSVDEWLSALPATVVRPADSDAVIDEMLDDLPLPPGFERARLDPDGAARDRYQLGFHVVAGVACGWFERWLRGDAEERTEAMQALRAVERSTVLEDMSREGHYGEVLHQYVEAIAADGTVVGGKALTVAESYKDALGC